MRGPSLIAFSLILAGCIANQVPRVSANEPAGDRMLAAYFEHETARLRDRSLANIETIADWKSARPKASEQLREMLGLDPMPVKTRLHPVVTRTKAKDDIIVECVYFQARPGLYVTGNLYRPAKVDERLPAVLYVCGHGGVKIDDVSYGNKVHYQHHGAWFARNGYICLTIDSLQLGEIESIHHGTYRYDMWWWLCRGYTPAGVEAWNCIRALDYLQSREDVDGDRLGVTGRSGGGIYSWWIAALDDRIDVAVPVAGITDLEDHVVDGCVEGHCDCMYFVNTHRWDYPQLAAMVAPRPLLISNTDRDRIFPLDGVVRTFESARRIYSLYDADDQIALNISAGPHQDTQELRINAFRWLNQHLRNDDELIADPATARFEPADLKVFDELPPDERNTSVHEWFVPAANAEVAKGETHWQQMRSRWEQQLNERVFAAWPEEADALNARLVRRHETEHVEFQEYRFTSQAFVELPLYIVRSKDAESPKVVLKVLDAEAWAEFQRDIATAFGDSNQIAADSVRVGETTVFFPPRGIGPTAWNADPRNQTQVRRRFYLLGQTLDSARLWDLRRAIQLLGALDISTGELEVQAQGTLAGIATYASIFEPAIDRLALDQLPTSHRRGPIFLNVQRFLDLPQAVTMAADRCEIRLTNANPDDWQYVKRSQAARPTGIPLVFETK